MSEKPEKRTFSNVVGSSSSFYPDLPRIPLGELLETEVEVLDAVVIDDFETDFGIHDLALMKVKVKDTVGTTACSGQVVIKKVKKALEMEALPLYATFVKPGRYYDVL